MKKSNLFFETFVSEFVEIIQDFEVTTRVDVGEDHTEEVRMPHIVQGMVMDVDSDFVYLSSDGADLTQAIPLNSIKYVSIIDLAQEALDQMPDPDDDVSYN